MRNPFDISVVLQHFVSISGELYRKALDGALSPVRRVDHGKPVCTVAGVQYSVPEVIWALNYGRWPKWPLVVLPGDSLTIENIFSTRLRQYRSRVTIHAGRFYHPYSPHGWITAAACQEHWLAEVRKRYLADLPYVLAVEASELALARSGQSEWTIPEVVIVERKSAAAAAAKPRKNPIVRYAKPRKPEAVEGCSWRWYKQQWLSVPHACHVSDDLMARCEAVLAGKVTVYDPASQRTTAQ